MLPHGGSIYGERILRRKAIDLIATDHLRLAQQASHSRVTQYSYGYGLGVRVMTNPE